MTDNPFDNAEARYHVLANDEGQHSLWPTIFALPAGWHIVHEDDNRRACLQYVTERWTEMRPGSDPPPR